MKKLIGALVLALALCGGHVEAQAPFAVESFDKALALAAREKKLVLVDFFTTWCAPCKALDRETWSDTAVRAWLVEKTVSVKIDAERQMALADKYRIDSYPTILLLEPDGTEVDRFVGFRAPAEFLADARDAVAGRDSVARAKLKLEGAGATDPMARMDYARALAEKGRAKEALGEFLWCFDHGAAADPGFVGVRASYLLDDIVALGRSYPPALEALRARRDAVEKEVLKATTDWRTTSDYAALNREMGEESRTLGVYDRLGAMGVGAARTREVLFHHVLDGLLGAKRYADVAAGAGDLSSAIGEQIREFDELKGGLDGQREAAEIVASLRGVHVLTAAKYYEALIGLGRLDDGAKAAKTLIAFENRAETYVSLIESAARAGKPDVARELAARGLASLPAAERGAVRVAAARLGLRE